MHIYIMIVIFSLFLALLCKEKGLLIRNLKLGNIRKRILLGNVIVPLPFIIFSCIRFNVGTDYYTYTNFYAEAIPLGEYLCEPLFNLLVKISVNVFHSPSLTVAVIGILFCYFIFAFIYHYKINKYYAILVFFLSGTFNFSLNIMRQMCIVGMFFYALKYLEDKNVKSKIKYFIIIGCSFFIHRTALIYIIFYFFYKIKFKKIHYIGMLIISYFMPGILRQILVFFSSKLGLYYGYFENKYDAGQPSYSLVILNLVIFLLILCFDNTDVDINILLLQKVQVMTLIFAVLVPIIPNGSRIVYMFIPGQCVYVPYLTKSIKNYQIRYLITFGTLLIYSLFFVYYFFINNYGETFPVSFIWG